MKITSSFFFAAVVLCLVSCSNNEESEQAVTTETATTQTETSLPAGGNADPSAAPAAGFSEQQLNAPYNPGLQQTPQGGMVLPSNPGYSPQQPQQQTMTIQPGQKTVTAPGMNPPHGEPGHRCDIQVGAPLNSPPGNAPAPASQGGTPTPMNITRVNADGSPVTTSPKQEIKMDPSTFLSPSNAPSPSPTPSGPTPEGMNPAHGEPGHRCDIAVGAPLNSPPGKVSEPMEIKMGEPEPPK